MPWLAVVILYAAIVGLAVVARGVYEVASPTARRRPVRARRWLIGLGVAAILAGALVG